MTPQRYWDARAAANFILGGSGAGLLIAVALVPANPYAIGLGLALIAAGLFAVWLETGKRLRALHVLFNPFTSWMTREAFAAVLVFPLGLGAILTGRFAWAPALAAAAFLCCQAMILRAARGIPAWRAPEVVPLIVLTGLAEGAALALFFAREPLLLAFFGAAVALRAAAWVRYRRAVNHPATDTAGCALLHWGSTLPLILLVAGLYVEAFLFAAAVAALATGAWLKLALVTRAAFHEPFTLPRAPVRGTR
jgi:phenylacetyl-CoA:acceptor oxidoreductase subunit 2